MRTVALAAVTILAAAPMQAATVSASLTGFSWTLEDLDPSDGVAPGISFESALDDRTFAATWLWLFNPYPSLVQEYQHSVSNPGAQAVRLSTNQQASASLSGSSNPPLNLSALATGSMVQPLPTGGGGFSAGARSREWHFSLTPGTRAVFSAEVTLTLEQDQGELTSVQSFGAVRASAVDYLLPVDTPPYSGTQLITMQLLAPDIGPRRLTGQVTDTFVNSGPGSATGYLDLNVGLTALSAIPPVPEPAEWALMLGGCTLLALARRRRVDKALDV